MVLGRLSEERGWQSDLLPSAHDTDTSIDATRTLTQLFRSSRWPTASVLQEVLPGQDFHSITCSGTSLLLIWMQAEAWEEGCAGPARYPSLPVWKPGSQGRRQRSPAARVCQGQEAPCVAHRSLGLLGRWDPEGSVTSQICDNDLGQSSSLTCPKLTGKNTPGLRVQAGGWDVNRHRHRGITGTNPQGAAPKNPPAPTKAPSVSPESQSMRGCNFTVAWKINPGFRKIKGWGKQFTKRNVGKSPLPTPGFQPKTFF